MDPREGCGQAEAVRPPERSEDGGPARPRPSDAPDDQNGEHGDAETYAVLGED
ncbi:hypothetical protein ACIRD3_05135 [Kitasatospora sp. NPDC093550]|uniref:hypothetical protein n=1 Tax=Kitasatospora sp. NPDC093550 TaxID=3364089 RepID=UPI0038204A79